MPTSAVEALPTAWAHPAPSGPPALNPALLQTPDFSPTPAYAWGAPSSPEKPNTVSPPPRSLPCSLMLPGPCSLSVPVLTTLPVTCPGGSRPSGQKLVEGTACWLVSVVPAPGLDWRDRGCWAWAPESCPARVARTRSGPEPPHLPRKKACLSFPKPIGLAPLSTPLPPELSSPGVAVLPPSPRRWDPCHSPSSGSAWASQAADQGPGPAQSGLLAQPQGPGLGEDPTAPLKPALGPQEDGSPRWSPRK